MSQAAAAERVEAATRVRGAGGAFFCVLAAGWISDAGLYYGWSPAITEKQGVQRVAFHLGPLPFYWYGLSIATGFLLGYVLMLWLARQRRFPANRVGDLGFFGVLGGLAGARALYVLTHWEQFASVFHEDPFLVLKLHRGGLVFYGALIGGTLAVYIYCRRQRLPFWTVADLAAAPVALGQAFGRLGCFLNGCCYGAYTESPLGFRYPFAGYGNILKEQDERGLLTEANEYLLGGTADVPQYCLPVVPIQLINAGVNLAIVAVLVLLFKRVRRPGQLFCIFLILYAGARFLTEFWRGDYPQLTFGLTSAQLLCLLVLPAGVVGYLWLGRRPAPPAPETP